MTSGNNPGGSRGQQQRPAPTIDLKATEVASEPTADAAGTSRSPGEGSSQTGPAEAEPEKAASADSKPEQAAVQRPRRSVWLPFAAGVVGAVLVLIVLAFVPGSWRGDDTAKRALAAKLARLESQVHDLSARPSPTGVDPKAFNDLAARVAKFETAAATPPSATPADTALDNRISTLEGAVSALGERIGVVARRTDDLATTAKDTRARADTAAAAIAALQKTTGARGAKSDLDALNSRVAMLEKSVKAIGATLARRSASVADDRAVRGAVAATLLKDAIERGGPIAHELAAAKSLAAEPTRLSPLDAFAETGVPHASALAHELTALLPKLEQAAGSPAEKGGFLDRLQANAESLVRIRPASGQPGDTPAAILSRVEAHAADADIAGALTELKKLPPSVRAPAQSWMTKAENRRAAVAAGRHFAAAALAALGQPSSEQGAYPQ